MREKAEKQKRIALSVVVPAYNVETLIGRCLASIAAQTLHGIECIVVDDGSTDRTAAVAERQMAEAAGVAWKLIRQENTGSAQARYAGVRASSGRYIGFVDADDYVDPGYFAALYRCAQKTRAEIIAGEITQEGIQKRQTNQGRPYADGAVITAHEARVGVFRRTHVYTFPVNKLFRKDLLTADCFPDRKMIGEDFTMILGALRGASSVALCKEAGYHYVTRRGSQTKQLYGETKREGYYNYRRILQDFSGTAAEERALRQYIMLEYLSCVLFMYRSKVHDREVEEGVLSFVRAHKKEYILHGKDSLAAKGFAALLGPVTHRIFFSVWPRMSC